MSLGLLLWAEWLIISRGAWAVIAIGVVVMLRFLDPLKRFSKPVVLLSIVIVLALPQTRNTLINLITLQGPSDLLQDPSLRQHSRQFTLNVVTIISNPFGHGLGAASYASSLGSSTVGWHANESFFGALAQQTGWIPLALFLLFLFSICQLCYRALERPRGSPMQRLVLMVVLGASMGYAFSAVFSEAAYGMLSSAMYWILTGVAVQIAYQPQSALERNK